MNFDTNELRQWLEAARSWFHMLLIWLLAWLALWMIRRLLRGLRTHIVSRVDARADARRIETLMNVFRYTANVVIIGVAIMLTLGIIGISITPILATAGVAGIAVGFGAQSLVKDFFTGLFLLIENQVSEGDLIEAAGKNGHVERVTLRHIRIRDYDGSVHFIPNGMITTVTNRSRGYAYAVIDLNVKRQDDVEHVFGLMREAGSAMRADPALGSDILDDLEIDGVEKIEDATVALRCRMRVKAGRQARMRREFLWRMKGSLDHLAEVKSSA
ncbi:MAG: mechanosensitive ion channel family protein [Noviherbaspirillum sp.]